MGSVSESGEWHWNVYILTSIIIPDLMPTVDAYIPCPLYVWTIKDTICPHMQWLTE
jgi:hypothetical protein